MIPQAFEYYAPASLEEAVGILDRLGGEGKVLAGGQSLLPLMKLRLAAPKAVVDLNRIPGLAYLREKGDLLRIGALARTNDLNGSDLIHARYPILSDAASVIADPLVRNLGTVGGNLSHGDPLNDLPACMIALRATYVVRGPGEIRTVPAEAFYVDTFATALEPNEILVEVQVPRARPGRGTAYAKLEKRAGDFPIAGVAAVLTEASGKIEEAGLGLTAVGPTALRAREAEDSVWGLAAGNAAFQRAAGLARDASRPVADLRGSVEYKRAMVALLARRALQRAHERARGRR
jgi:carbon-monoxide dehydrogenase medium subunit